MDQSLAVAQPVSCDTWHEVSGSASGTATNVELIDPLASRDWDREVHSHPKSNIFHLSAWAKVMAHSYGHKPIYLRFYRRDKLVALVPIMEVNSPITGVRGVSLPFSDFCAPLMFDDDAAAFPLLEEINKVGLRRNWRYFEIRSSALADDSCFPTKRYYEHELDLTPGPVRLFDAIAPSARRATRKAEKSGLDVKMSDSWDAMRDFYRLHLRTRRRHGLPPQPLSFFRNIHREIIELGHGFIMLAKSAMRPVAAAVFFHSGREALYKFGASNASAQSLRPSNLVMWKAIEHLANSGFRTLHFGRTDLDDDGLRRFKRSWGTVERELRYFRYAGNTRPLCPLPSRDGRPLYTHIFRRLPLLLNRTVGKFVYPHLD